jgi:hypothetical protein
MQYDADMLRISDLLWVDNLSYNLYRKWCDLRHDVLPGAHVFGANDLPAGTDVL